MKIVLRILRLTNIALCVIAGIFAFFATADAAKPAAKETSWHQYGYWFRDDDGNEAEATGWGLSDLPKNADIGISDADDLKDGALRLRIGIAAQQSYGTLVPRLAFKATGTTGNCEDGDWIPIGSSGEAPFVFRASPNVPDGSLITQQLNQGGSFVSGLFLATADTAPALALAKNERTEYEWSLQYTKPFSAEAGTYTFRAENDGKPLDTYGACPVFAVGALQSLPTANTGHSERPLPPASIAFSGTASPHARVKIVARDLKRERDIPVKEITAGEDGGFNIMFVDTQGFNSYGFVVTDKEGRVAQNKVFNFNTPGYVVLQNDLLISPTLGFARDAVPKGDMMAFVGYAAPESTVTVRIDREQSVTAKAEKDGSYRALMNTARLAYGPHTAIAEQGAEDGPKSAYSPEKTFTVSKLMNPKVDFDGSGTVDIRDLSVFAGRWISADPQKRRTIDLNGDGTTDISDLSIFIRAMKR